MHRKWILGSLLVACCAGGAVAQEFPQKTVRFIVPFPPGGATDGLARILAEKMTEAVARGEPEPLFETEYHPVRDFTPVSQVVSIQAARCSIAARDAGRRSGG